MKDNRRQQRERINTDIRVPQVRVIDENSNALGVMSTQEALKIAESRSLDLVEISPTSKPPVCKIVDYGKYVYERAKKEKQAKKNQTSMQVKEIRFNPNTDEHDIDFKTKHLKQFLIEGHKVKASVTYKGRMITHREIGERLMSEVIGKLNGIGKLEAPAKMKGKQLIAYFIPDKNKIQAAKDDAHEEKEASDRKKKEQHTAAQKDNNKDISQEDILT